MVDCIWKVAEEDRHCEYCSYRGGCVRYPKAVGPKEKYIDVMSGVIGEDVLKKSRRAKLVWARYMVAYQMRQDGYSSLAIGKCLGLDHCTVLYSIRKITCMLESPCFYPKEIDIWQKFRETLSL